MSVKEVKIIILFDEGPAAHFNMSPTGRLYPERPCGLKDAAAWQEATEALTQHGLTPPHFDAPAQLNGKSPGLYITVYPWFDLASSEAKAAQVAWAETEKAAFDAATKDKGDGLGRIVVWSQKGHPDWYWSGSTWAIQRSLAHIYPDAACAVNAVPELKKGIPEGDSIIVIITTDPPTTAKDKGPWVIQHPTLTGPEFWTGKGWSSDPRDAFQYGDKAPVNHVVLKNFPSAKIVSISEV